jgi:hypothetical protein
MKILAFTLNDSLNSPLDFIMEQIGASLLRRLEMEALKDDTIKVILVRVERHNTECKYHISVQLE